MSVSRHTPKRTSSISRYGLVTVGLALCAAGGYRELGILTLPLTLGVAISWFVLPEWYAISIGELGFVAAAQGPALPSLALVNAGFGCILCSNWSEWHSGGRLTTMRIGYGALVFSVLLWVVHQLYADVWVTAGAFGVTSTCVFYLLYRYHRVTMGLTEGQHE